MKNDSIRLFDYSPDCQHVQHQRLNNIISPRFICMERSNKNSLKLLRLEQSFHLDGNKKTLNVPQYQPLFDQHLRPFFLNYDRLKILKKNKIINRNYQVVDSSIRNKYKNAQTLSRPSTQHLNSDRVLKLIKTVSTNLSLMKESLRSKSGRKQEKSPILPGLSQLRFTRRRKLAPHTQPDRSLSKQMFQSFLDRQKQKVQGSLQKINSKLNKIFTEKY